MMIVRTIHWCAPALAATLILAGCASERAERAQEARQALLGLSRAALMQCAGDPQRESRQGGVEFLTYSNQPWSSGGAFGPTVGVGADSTVPQSGIDQAASSPVLQEIRSDYCEVTFSLVNNRVDHVGYRTPAGFGQRRYAQCYDIVATCMRVANPAAAVTPSPE